jgi:predicted glycoside hydrolase/deacetylase ChbG (UPF0249 family)
MLIKLPLNPDPRISFLRKLGTRQLVLTIQDVVIQPWDDVETDGNIQPATHFAVQMLQRIVRDWAGRGEKVAEEFVADVEEFISQGERQGTDVDDHEREKLQTIARNLTRGGMVRIPFDGRSNTMNGELTSEEKKLVEEISASLSAERKANLIKAAKREGRVRRAR